MMMSYFSRDELMCQHCGEYYFDSEFMALLNNIREEYGKPMIVNSGYRCQEHPLERAKTSTGAHSLGKAVDIRCSGADALELIRIAMEFGIKRIGVNQKGSTRFIHLDNADELPSPAIWSY